MNVWSGRIGLRGRADAIYNGAEAEAERKGGPNHRGRQDALTAALKVKTEHPESIGGATHVTHHMRSPIEEQSGKTGLLPEHPITNRMADGSLAAPAASRRRVLQRVSLMELVTTMSTSCNFRIAWSNVFSTPRSRQSV